ncbi:SDR family NAD(P)-dependent oxidoreductase [Pseudoalteromonas sp. AS84]|jgi:short-subunit dehydrogenase|uniref:SDR family NAD(P)-dependent oxidoreductase n=2 Tax=root TaxID=1 RepID=A0A7X9U5C2_9GAMM|nr:MULTISPECIES: SDR family NAD(P)-dependent oxidoreductase [Pseudoalteromonas]NMF47854.1 SDR family NAD(P)-dependent oxidoreductase [Pseudoalteromonas arctica]TVU78039.1 SDR family NAD(P)-dependent oxidoreductase [Pseudoalteromonas elyakovii]HDY90822.1 SDR family NAD(P)-dependent oxidoreductase [Pseudoalteromonas sp.]HDZ34835.1 SDR family NAD(P)-dependent oxidoreductase [Pseudoalteromonas sp.]
MITLITGATSGIGEQLAIKYAQLGDTVIACGRNSEKLAELAKYDNIQACKFDATNLHDIKESTIGFPHFDRVILNAGNCEYIDDARNFDSALFERVINVNLLSMGYCLEALLPKINSGGQLVLVSSSVTYLALPRSEAYGASKAGVSYLAKSLAVDLDDVDVTLVHPGFVKTPLTNKNDFPMPMAVTAEKAADYMIKGIHKRRKDVHFPYRFTLILKALRILPLPIWLKIAKGLAR